MKANASQVPIEIQLQAICLLTPRKSYELLSTFLPELKAWDLKNHESLEAYNKRVRESLNFTAIDLIRYLVARNETCVAIMMACSDKRYTPSTVIDSWKDNLYRVGWMEQHGHTPTDQIHVFSSFAEATADYVLFSWGFPRLSKSEANWIEYENFPEANEYQKTSNG